VFLLPDQYFETPISTLLVEVSKGRIPFDHRLIRVLLGRQDETALAIAQTKPDDWRFDITAELIDLSRAMRDARVLPFLMKQLEDDPDETVFDAFRVLGQASIQPLLDAYPRAKEPVKEEILFALAALGIQDERVQKLLTEGGDEFAQSLYRDGGTSEEFDIFADTDKEGLPIVNALSVAERFELLESSSEDYRILAAASLFHEDYTPAQETALLDRAKSDSSEHVRAHCWQALDNSTGKAEIADEMIARLKDTSRSDLERSGLLVGLSALTERSEVRDAVQELYGKPETRLKALEAMWRSLNPDFAEYFPEHLDDANKEIRRVALRGIGAQGLTSELSKVRALLKDEDLREDALFAYALAIPGKDSPAFLRSLLKKIETEAGGFSEEEEEIVRTALDERLRAAGKPPIFQQ